MAETEIKIIGAREHNLQNIDVTIPRDKLVVITGVSGSGKSSLAFDTIFAEGQRRYVESLSAYARQFLGRMEKPDVDHIDGLSPSISIDQKGVSRNPRSTVGTITEIYDYLRLLFARIGRPHCHICEKPVQPQTVQQIVDSILRLDLGKRIMLLAPLVTHMKGEHLAVLDSSRQSGFVRVRVDGEIKDLSDEIKLNKNQWHDIEIVVDRLTIKSEIEIERLTESVETALQLSEGTLIIAFAGTQEKEDIVYSERLACITCDVSIAELEPRNFSFNTPYGACPTCTGLGFKLEVDPDLVIQDPNLSLDKGAVIPWANSGSNSPWYASSLTALADHYGFSVSTPIKELNSKHLSILLYGSGRDTIEINHRTKKGKIYRWRTAFDGVIPSMERRHTNTESESVREEISNYMSQRPCASCRGLRLKPDVLAVTVIGMNIMAVTQQSVEQALKWVNASQSGLWFTKNKRKKRVEEPLTGKELAIAQQILKEIETRLGFLSRVGLDYLGLNRPASTLSGGEGQRIRLATQIGSSLMGVLYVCDEPSVGLHPSDNDRLIETLKQLRDVGNTVMVVEHDEAVMRAADHIIDLGPGAGENGGNLVAEGPIRKILASKESITGAYLSGRRSISVPEKRRSGNGNFLKIFGARANNLKNINVQFPLGTLICITGVSGSGKSTLINQILAKKLAQHFYRSKDRPGPHDHFEGIEHVDKIINIDQSPIGRTPRSNPATYTGVFTPMRELFAAMPEAKARGYKPGRFSFNVKGGRCEGCSGAGYVQIEMQFLPDVTVACDQCRGARYNREALEIKYKGQTISDVLDMTVSEASKLFQHIPSVARKMQTLMDVGLGYIRLGQPATTLSGGEAQRIKLSAELSRRSTGKTVYVLDEPTTGLSFDDANKLIRVLHRLVEAGNSVILIEHHLDLIKNADWLIDLGPSAGERGGKIIAEGTPEYIASISSSSTGIYLSDLDGIKANNQSPGWSNSKVVSSNHIKTRNVTKSIFPPRPDMPKRPPKRNRRRRYRRSFASIT